MNFIKSKTVRIFIFILAIALLFRLVGLNWDQGHHLHPDERFMTMVASSIRIPPSISNYFSQKESTLNPYNNGYNFYVYGTFPLLITRLFGEVFKMTEYNSIHLVGRYLSVFFDCLTVILVFKIAYSVTKSKKNALLSMYFYAISVFPIQQSHFFAVDTFTVFFSTLTVFSLLKFIKTNKPLYPLISGICFGLTLANKISIIVISPIFFLFILIDSRDRLLKNKDKKNKIFFTDALINLSLFGLGSLLSFRLFQPYAFDGLYQVSKHFLDNINDARKMMTGDIDYPPNIQWAYTKPLIHPFVSLFLWGLGPVITLLSIFGIFRTIIKRDKKTFYPLLFLLLISSSVFFYQGIQLNKYLRYFYPIYPFLCVFAGLFFTHLYSLKINYLFKKVVILLIFAGSLIPAISFVSIYLRPHSRVSASEWIYANIPGGSTITSEEWDDSLPLGIPGKNQSYKFVSLAIYNPESLEKWEKISQQISEADYIILSSNRLYSSIPRMPQRYPVSTLFYKLLFSEKLGFKKVAEFNSRPCFPPLGTPIFCLNDDSFEESFTVYDHPVVKIYQKSNYTSDLFLPLLEEKLINSTKYLNPKETNHLNIFNSESLTR